MKILTVDVGTGTQDVLLFDSEREPENCFKLVLPAPTAVIAQRVRAATTAGRRLVLTGSTMGGGPSHWAVTDHVTAGFEAYATPDAARTFDDDLDAVSEMGIRVISEDEAVRLASAGTESIRLGDFWLDEILQALALFGVAADPDALAVAVFDHGAAPPGTSDRVFRFDYLRAQLSAGSELGGFGFVASDIPASMTRLLAVAQSAPGGLPLFVMDTAPAAVLGALEDPAVATCRNAVVANVGNFHCLAFHLVDGSVAGLFEHHTGEVTPPQLGQFVRDLGQGTLTNASVFDTKGHGALVRDPGAPPPELLAVTGPRRQVLVESGLRPYLAVPHGDMMLAGNFGLLRAFAAHDDFVRHAVENRLGPPRWVG